MAQARLAGGACWRGPPPARSMPAPPLLPGESPVDDLDNSVEWLPERPTLGRLCLLAETLARKSLTRGSKLILEAADKIREQEREIADLQALIAEHEGAALLGLKPAAIPAGPLLPGDTPRYPALFPWEENPAPDSRSPFEAVISQQQAVRALVRHYGWIHTEANTLHRPHWPFPNVSASSIGPDADDSVIELVEIGESIWELARRSAEATGSAHDGEAA